MLLFWTKKSPGYTYMVMKHALLQFCDHIPRATPPTLKSAIVHYTDLIGDVLISFFLKWLLYLV